MNTENSKRFQVGSKYLARFYSDYDATCLFTVIKRTDKFITVTSEPFGTRRCKIYDWRGTESALPTGTYSMSPSINAVDSLIVNKAPATTFVDDLLA